MKNITALGIANLGGCNSLNISSTNIADSVISNLWYCHTLDLSCVTEITDASVANLGRCHTLKLAYCLNISDVGVYELVGLPYT